MSGIPSSLPDGVTQHDLARAKALNLLEPMELTSSRSLSQEFGYNTHFPPQQTHSQSGQLTLLASEPSNVNATPASYPDRSSGGGRIFEDPPIDPFRICSGAIVYVHSKEICDTIGPIRSWPTNRVGPRRNPDGPAMRDPGYKHPAIILRWGRNDDDTWWILICNITSFDETTLKEYMQYRRDYENNVNNRAITRKLVKFYNTLPIAHRLFPPKYRNEVSFLSTTGGKLGCQSYVAMEGIYRVSDLHLRSYGDKYKNSWDMRLDKASYEYLMEEFNLIPQKYETEEKLVGAGTPRINVERRLRGNALVKSHPLDISTRASGLLSGTLFAATHMPASGANSPNVEIPKDSAPRNIKNVSTSTTGQRIFEVPHNDNSESPADAANLAFNMPTVTLETAATVSSAADPSRDSVKAKGSFNYNTGVQPFVPRDKRTRLRQPAPASRQPPILPHMPGSQQDYYDMNLNPYPNPWHDEYGANYYQGQSHYQGGQQQSLAQPQHEAPPQYHAQLHSYGQLQYQGQVNCHGQMRYRTQTHVQTEVNCQGQVPINGGPAPQQSSFPQYRLST